MNEKTTPWNKETQLKAIKQLGASESSSICLMSVLLSYVDEFEDDRPDGITRDYLNTLVKKVRLPPGMAYVGLWDPKDPNKPEIRGLVNLDENYTRLTELNDTLQEALQGMLTMWGKVASEINWADSAEGIQQLNGAPIAAAKALDKFKGVNP